MDKAYTYKRKDGGETWCYGVITEDSNFSIVCEDEYMDGVAGDIDGSDYNTWRKVCKYLEENYNDKVEQITTC